MYIKQIVSTLFIAVFLLIGASPVLAVDVEIQHPVYRFLDRCELKGLFDFQLSGSLPYSRKSVAHKLELLIEKANDLNRIEKKQLAAFIYEFEVELPGDIDIPESLKLNKYAWVHNGTKTPWRQLNLFKDDPRYIYKSSDDDYLLTLNPHYEQSFDNIDNGIEAGSVNRFATGIQIFGYFYKFGFHSITRDYHISGDLNLVDTTQYPKRYSDDLRDGTSFGFDETDAKLSFEVPHVYVMFGKASNRWSRGASGTFSMSGNASPYTQIRLRLDMGPTEVTFLQGKLIQEPAIRSVSMLPDSTVYSRDYAEKWIAAHRYQVNVGKRLQVSIYDLLVYGNRGLDMDYLPPLTFLWSAEHYNRDQDNILMGLDFRLLLGKRISLYGDWFLDELQFGQLTTDWFGNKQGYMLGARQVDFAGISNSDVSLEYVKLRPYVYTHVMQLNNYSHYGANLGYPMQPNSDRIFFSWQQQIRQNLNGRIELSHQRHGANPASGKNVGGDIRRGHVTGVDSETAVFLDGDLETLDQITFGIEYEISYQLFLTADMTLGWYSMEPDDGGNIENTQNSMTVSLSWFPSRWR
jgi:Capsule assembly protein Wzi